MVGKEINIVASKIATRCNSNTLTFTYALDNIVHVVGQRVQERSEHVLRLRFGRRADQLTHVGEFPQPHRGHLQIKRADRGRALDTMKEAVTCRG